MAATIFVLACLTSSFIAAEALGPHEITKITLDIWGHDYCGSNYGPYIEILSKNGEKRNTYYHGPFSSGTTLIWDNNGENRYGGKNLGGVSGFQVKPFQIQSKSPTVRNKNSEEGSRSQELRRSSHLQKAFAFRLWRLWCMLAVVEVVCCCVSVGWLEW